MTSVQPTWLSPQAYGRLRRELAVLRELCDGDAGGDAADDNFVAVQRARRLRMQRIQDLLVNAVVGEDPPDDGVAEPGMVLTVRYDDTGDTETFLLGARGAEHGDLEVYSINSPLGSAIAGARPGERRTYLLPTGAAFAVTLLSAVPYGVYLARTN